MSHDVENLLRIGMSERSAFGKAELYARCQEGLDAMGAAHNERWSAWVPGRIEVFGKHTDYAGGRSLLCTAERGFAVRVAPRSDATVRALDVATGERCEISLGIPHTGGPAWSVYVSTMAQRLARNFDCVARGVDLAFGSDLPPAAGLSSSTALMLAVFVALAKSNDLRSAEEFRREIFSREELAAYLGCVENGEGFRSLTGDAGVGTAGGSQDHTAIMCSAPGQLVQYGFAPVRREAVFAWPATHTFVVASSGVAAEKTGEAQSPYNYAAALVRHALHAWNAATGRYDESLSQAIRSAPDSTDEMRRIAKRAATDEFPKARLLERIDQFVLEAYEIIPAVGQALATGAMADLGHLAQRSHHAAATWLHNQIPETNTLVALATEHGAIAASAFGAGFGGSVWAIVPTGHAIDFAQRWDRAYRVAFPAHEARASVFVTQPGPSAMQW